MRRSRATALAGFAAGAVLVGGIAGAAATPTTFTGCLVTGNIIQVAKGTTPLKPCQKPEQQVSWNSEGPVGPASIVPGPEGPKGDPGDPGADAVIGANSINAGHLATGAVGTSEIQESSVTTGKIDANTSYGYDTSGPYFNYAATQEAVLTRLIVDGTGDHRVLLGGQVVINGTHLGAGDKITVWAELFDGDEPVAPALQIDLTQLSYNQVVPVSAVVPATSGEHLYTVRLAHVKTGPTSVSSSLSFDGESLYAVDLGRP